MKNLYLIQVFLFPILPYSEQISIDSGFWAPFGVCWDSLGGLLGLSWGLLRSLGALFGFSWPLWGLSWALLGF